MPKFLTLLLTCLLLESCWLSKPLAVEQPVDAPPPPLVAPRVDGHPGSLDDPVGGAEMEPAGGLSYSADAIYFDRQPLFLWSAELPYYRFPAQLWGPRLEAARNAGVRFITSYVPWNLHEPAEGKFDFTGAGGDSRTNLVGFIQQVARLGMYFIPKPGPFICAEVRHGGIPDWLTASHPEVAMRNERGRVVRFRQDGTVLPDPLNPTYVEYVRRWYTRLYREVLREYEYSRGPIVALQVDNELIYSTTSLANPFSWGYTPAVQELYRAWLGRTYGDIDRYNRAHASSAPGFGALEAPRSGDWRFRVPQQWLSFQDWVLFKEWYGAAVLRKYAGILKGLGVSVPLYHNAGMLEDQAPMAFGALSRELWLGVNFWLHPHPLASLASYTQGMRRLKQLRGSQPERPSIAPEVNWGWGSAQEFDFLARYTMPFSKASNVYPLADSSGAGRLSGRPYSNARQPYPGDAPLDDRGRPRPAYWRMARLVGYTRAEGAGLAEAASPASITLGSYAPYNAPSLYLQLGRARWSELNRVLASGTGSNEFLQEFMEGFIRRDAECRVVDLQASRELAGSGLLIVYGQESMDASTQRLLARYVLDGGTLVLLPQLPTRDLELRPATVLKEALLPGLEPGRGSGAFGELRIEGYPGRLRGKALTRLPDQLPPGCRVLGRNERGEPAALEKRAGRGRLVFLGTYVCDPDFFLWLAEQLGYEGRFAWSDDPQVEVVPLENRQTAETYLFVINRGRSGCSPRIYYRESLAPGEPEVLRTSLAGGSVSIVALQDGELRSASLNGESGVFLGGVRFELRLDRAAEVDLLRTSGGDYLFRADRPTQVELRLPASRASGLVTVLSGSGERVAVGLDQGALRFGYSPAEGRLEYYRIVLPAGGGER